MGLPTPKIGETRTGYMARCMGDEVSKGLYPLLDKRKGACLKHYQTAVREGSPVKLVAKFGHVKCLEPSDGS